MPLAPSEKFRVLLVESDPGDALLLRRMLDQERQCRFYISDVAASLASAVSRLRHSEFDLVVLDLMLTDSEGLETFVGARTARPDVPIMVLCSNRDEDLAAEAVRQGAKDYLIKGEIDGHLLHRAMRYAIQRARADAALSRERELLHTLLDNIPDRIYFKDCRSRFIRINRALTDLFHLAQPEDAYGKTDADFYGDAHARTALADEQRVMETGEPLLNKIEFEVLADGRKSWSLTTKLPLRDREGRIVGTCGISREISALKEMEEELAKERNLLRSVIDNLPDHIYLKDAQGVYLLDNRAHQRWLGASGPEEVLGRTVFDFFPQEMAERFHQDDQRILASGQALTNHEERISDSQGQFRWVLTTKAPWRNEEGEIYGLVCISRDVTVQKEAGENLARAYSELQRSREEVLAAMAKLQTAHQELRNVQLQLIEAEKMKSIGRLAAGVAHEVKNPLAILKMGAEFLSTQDFAQDATIKAILSDMADAVNRADGVIRGLLDFSAPKKLQVQAESLNEIIERALVLVRGDLKGVEVERELQRDLPRVQLDAAKISQVFINLITNAIHAMEGRGILLVRTYSKQLTGVGRNISDSRSESFRVGQTIVVAEIDDTGHGIPDDKLGKIFEPFYTTKPTGKGTGLGLSVTKTIIDLHGGTIDIRNRPEGGTRATVMFQV